VSVLEFDPFTEPHRSDPGAFYQAAHEREPVCWSPVMQAWMVTRHADISAILHDPLTYSSSNVIPSQWDTPEAAEIFTAAGCVAEGSQLIQEDGPEHAILRRVVDHAFSGRRIRPLIPVMQARAGELIDSLSATADLRGQFADPFVRTVISAAMGIPAADVDLVSGWNNDLVVLETPPAPVELKVDAAPRIVAYEHWITALASARRADPQPDFISDLVNGGPGFDPVSENDLQYLFRGVRLAGHETTRDTITTSIYLMLRERELWEGAVANAATIPRIIEEVLRYEAPHRGLMRITMTEVELGGVVLPAGSPLVLMYGAGNRDGSVFADPTAVQLSRANIREHLAFGSGRHRCPGEGLARTEVRIALEVLTQRMPTLRLAEGFEPSWAASFFFRGLESLPVTW
jgi:cytochrome P450